LSQYKKRYQVIHQLSLTSMMVKECLRKEFLLHGYDVTIDNFAILSCLWTENHLSQQELCERTCKNKSNLTRILDTMEKKKLITRTPNPNDRRSFLISLTKLSESLEEHLLQIANEVSTEVLGGFKDDEHDKIIEYLSLVTQRIELHQKNMNI
jgi:DNA-binding MarR family transcriptional regulator